MGNYLAISPDRRVCPVCEGKAGDCNLCGGIREISLALSRLYDADQYVRGHSPDWSGRNEDHDGVTAYSLAEWFRRSWGGSGETELLDPRAAAGFFADDTGDEQRVIVTASEGEIIFYGFSWGYGGEGPSGLAAVLADAGFFDTLAEARTWIASQDGDQPWELNR